MEKYMNDLIIIGGGAAGLAAAVAAKRSAPSMQVTVLEKKDKPGKKLRATGNGRCNITNTALATAPSTIAFLSHWEFLRGRTAKEESTPFQKARRVWQRFSQTS